jgi:hypothetical protein
MFLFIKQNNPKRVNLPPKRGSGVTMIGAISNRQSAMRFFLQSVIPKKEREATDAAGEIFYRFIKSLDNYPIKANLKTIFVMDGHPMHRKPKTRKHL